MEKKKKIGSTNHNLKKALNYHCCEETTVYCHHRVFPWLGYMQRMPHISHLDPISIQEMKTLHPNVFHNHHMS